MLAALAFLRSGPGMALAGALAFALYTGFIWIKATNAANDRWKVQMAAATEKVRQKQHARARRIEERLRVQIDLQRKARLSAEQTSQELRDELLADKSDPAVDVGNGTDLDRVFRNTLYKGRRDGTAAAGRPGQP